jgi:tripartite-type tricarboxylate transporter receptor subunit TctC
VPTLAETYPGVRSASWFSVVAPPNTPADVCARLSQVFADIVASAEGQTKLNAMGLRAVGSTPAEMAVLLSQERER